MVKLISEAHPDLIDAQSMIGWTPVMFACRYGYLDILQYLHKAGALLERERGYCALHAACYGGDTEIVRYLLEEAKVSPNPESNERIPMFICLGSNVSSKMFKGKI